MDSLVTSVETSENLLAKYDVLTYVPWLRNKVFGNSLHAYILTTLSFLVIWLVLAAVRRYVWARLQRYGQHENAARGRFLLQLVHEIRPYIFPVLALYAATKRLEVPESLEQGLHILTVALVTMQIVRMASLVVSHLVSPPTSTADPVANSTKSNIVALLEVGLWIAGVLFVLDNAGYNISTLIAGLGIGGVAIALAAQAVLGDTFSSFAIALDKPFEVGDFINVDNMQGTVEHIGLKTTRVRSVGGELLVFANSDLTRSRIRNFKRMSMRRATFKVNVHPQTPLDKLKHVVPILTEAVTAQTDASLDRACFVQFSDAALVFEVVYGVPRPDYKLYVETQEAINFHILEQFAKAGIYMAFNPTTATIEPEH